MENWKDIVGFEGFYQVSDLGRVKSLSRNSIRRGRIYPQKESILRQSGLKYLSVSLQKEGISKRCNVHRLVANAFIPNPENKPEVNHINGIKTDNRSSQLEWVTRRENEDHSILNKLKHIPTNKKLSEKDVLDIKTKIISGFRQKDLAVEYDIHPTTISKIVNGKSWIN